MVPRQPGQVLTAHRAAVLGSPIAHSLSPALHRAAYAHLGLDDWSYDVVEVADAPGLAAVLDGGWSGLSLTMPLKRLVLPMLDDVSDLAAAVGAVNTVTGPRGRRRGDNTDVGGIVTALREGGLPGLADGEGCVLGGGATAASAVAALAALGDRRPTLVVRDPARAGATLQAATRLGAAPRVASFADGPAVLGRARATVSTVPTSGGGVVVAALPRAVAGVLLDVVYAPWPTDLALAWRSAGGAVVSGAVMLLHQAGEQLRLMTGHEAPVDVMREALAGALGRAASV